MRKTIKLHFIENFSEGDVDQQLEAMKEVFEFTGPEEADVFFCASIFKLQEAKELKARFRKPLAIYCWDYYKWKHDSGENIWQQYAAFMRGADLIFVPSATQQLRLKELLGLDSEVVKTGILTYEHETTDAGFILDPLRHYEEENKTWAEDAAKLLGIPLIHSEHQYNQEEFRKLVASCTFMTSCVREASTGALTLSEGLWLGKPSLVSNSPYQGARDYLGKFGHYFQYDNFEDLCVKMKEMWEDRPKIDILEARRYMRRELSFKQMAEGLREKICQKFT